MSEKDLEFYMSQPYKVEIIPEDDGSGFTAVVPELPGCMTAAPTLEELWPLIEDAKQVWLEVALAEEDYVPLPTESTIIEYSGKFIVRIAKTLHKTLAERADIEGISLNQFVATVLADGLSRWTQLSESRTHRHLIDTRYRFGKEVIQAYHLIEGDYYRPGQEKSIDPGIWADMVPKLQVVKTSKKM